MSHSVCALCSGEALTLLYSKGAHCLYVIQAQGLRRLGQPDFTVIMLLILLLYYILLYYIMLYYQTSH